MKILPAPIARLDEINRCLCLAAGGVAGVLMLAIMAGGVVDVFGRWLFDSPLEGGFELTQLALMSGIFLGFAYAELDDQHIKVDLLYEHAPKTVRMTLDLLSGIFKTAIVLTLTFQLLAYQGRLEAGQRTTTVLRIPQYDVIWLAIGGSAIFTFAVIVGTIVRAMTIDQRESEPLQRGAV